MDDNGEHVDGEVFTSKSAGSRENEGIGDRCSFQGDGLNDPLLPAGPHFLRFPGQHAVCAGALCVDHSTWLNEVMRKCHSFSVCFRVGRS